MSGASAAKKATEVVIALGSNVGNRVAQLEQAVLGLAAKGIQIERLSGLYDTAPAHVHDQPRFLNACLLAHVSHEPHALLRVMKAQEAEQGRSQEKAQQIRFGPRPVDIDLILYANARVSDGDTLQVPHPRLHQRPFVLKPLEDLLQPAFSSSSSAAFPADDDMYSWWQSYVTHWRAAGGQEADGELERVFPVAHGQLMTLSCRHGYPDGKRPVIVSAVNATPDSFSDAGVAHAPEAAADAAEALVQAGADIIDVGGESTQPGAEPVGEQQELQRVLPAIQAIRNRGLPAGVLLSVDTYRASVAQAAVDAGVHIVNDVSGGTLDDTMHATVAQSGAAYVLGHMRGNPKTMQQSQNTSYTNVCEEVGAELGEAVHTAMCSSGLPNWRTWVDPGIGFAKGFQGNLELISGIGTIRQHLHAHGADAEAPVMMGPSRKGFLGKLTGEQEPSQRDYATSAAVAACVASGADALRVHNARAGAHAASVAHALWNHSPSS